MNLRSWLLAPVVGIIVLASAALPNYFNNTDPEREKVLMQAIVDGLKELHYQPQPIDDEFSKRIYDLYLKRLDGGKRFFTEEDIKKLSKYDNKLDDQILNGDFTFFNLSLELYDKRRNQVQEFYRGILSQPFDFSINESLETDPDKSNFPKNEAELKELWRKSLKYQVMTRLVDVMEEQKKAQKEEGFKEKSFETLEQEAREKILQTHDDWFFRMGRIKRDDRLSTFLNALTAAYDPHTNYFPPEDKENFDITMSGRLEGIGARLQEDGKYVKVVDVVPGSPSWKQGELEVGDKIMAVAQGSSEAVDATDMPIDDVVKMIRGNKGTEVRLTVRKRDNSKKIISIIRDIVELDESYVKSAILNYQTQTVGYIYLPKFYADFQNSDGRRCAADVAVEIEKLKAENINGIILDLRNNGGGSLSDVVEMSGLFIEEGPIVQVKTREGRSRVLKDSDPSVQYSGPLVIMVNAFSASASEIMAAAMQDYKRAIIVGSSPTFGKGTVQQFIELDRIVPSNFNAFKPLGAVKLTTQKFYRVDGGTTQLKGVTPDIIIPDDYTYIEVGEKEEDYPMGWDEIPAARYSTLKMGVSDKVLSASQGRISADAALAAIDRSARRLKQRRENTLYTLHLESFQNEIQQWESEESELKKFEKDIEGLEVNFLKADLPEITANEGKNARMEAWRKEIKKDLQLKETLAIMKDIVR